MMRVQNFTNVSTQLIRELIAFVRPPGISNFDIAFKNDGDGSLHGYAYTHGTDYHMRDGKRPQLITIHVPKYFTADPFTLRLKRKRRTIRESKHGGYMTHDTFTYGEELAHIIAHELRHLWQRKVKSGRRVWGARGCYSERDADAYAIRMVRAWRRRVVPQPARVRIEQAGRLAA